MAAVMRKRKGPSPAWAAYYQAEQDWERETERLKAECGVTAGHEAEAAACEAVNSVKADLLDTPAKTLAGLIFKARYAAREDNAVRRRRDGVDRRRPAGDGGRSGGPRRCLI